MRHYVFRSRWKRAVARAIDAAGAPFARRARAAPTAARNLLVVRLDHIGDVVCLLPFLEALARLRPARRVTTLTGPAGAVLLRDTPGVDERLVYDAPWFARRRRTAAGLSALARLVRGRGFDLSLEMTGDARHHLALALAGIPCRAGYGVTGGGFLLHHELPWDAAAHTAERNMRFLDLLAGTARTSVATPRLVWRPTDSERAWLAGLGGGRRLIFHVDAGTPSRRWPAGRFAALAGEARRAGFVPVFVGLDPELSPAVAGAGVDLTGRTTLGQLITLIQASEGMVSADSGPAHIAAALARPVLVLWSGTADPAIWRPRGTSVLRVEAPVPCAPCGHLRCPLPRHACMDDLTVERVRPEFEALLGAARG